MKVNKKVRTVKLTNDEEFKLVFSNMYKPLYSYALTFTENKHEAKDIAQNCFIALWEKRDDLLGQPYVKKYLFKTAYNLYLNQYKRRQNQLRIFDELKYKALQSRLDGDNEIAKERIEHLNHLIDMLPPRCKKILLLNKKEGKKYTEIADTLGISVKTVESQMRIAFQKIREGFKKDILVLFVYLKSCLLEKRVK